MSSSFCNVVKIVMLVLTFECLSMPVLAQKNAMALEEVIVTSQRKETSMQKVPVAVTALGVEQMELKQVTNVSDLQYQVPNISLAINTGTSSGARVFLRGVGEDESRVSADPAVGIYVDGVYVGRQVGALFDLVDLERVEVLRGPQGTLYGRNSNGGAIKLVSKAPQLDANSLSFNVTVGNENRFDAKVTGNLVIADSTAIRATLLNKSRDGFHTLNPNGDLINQAGSNVGEVDSQAFRFALLQNFNDNWSANLSFDYTDDGSDPVPDSAAPTNDSDNNLFTIEPIPGSLPCTVGSTAMGCFLDYSSDVETMGTALNVSGSVGDYNVVSITGYRSLEDDLSTRIGALYLQQTDQDQLSQEFTVSSNSSGSFNFISGLYYFMEDVQLMSTFAGFPHFLDIETQAWAVFFQSTYEFTDTLTLITGARYTDEKKDLNAMATSPFSGNTGVRDEQVSFDNTTYTVSLNNQFTDKFMGYVSYSTGFKSGGWSPDCFAATAGDSCFRPVDEETLDTIEFGIRSDLLDDRLRVNLTYFFNQYDDLQIAATVPGLGFTRFNVDETQISGFEAELVFKATENISLNATLGTLDAEYKSVTLEQASGLTNSGASANCGGNVSIECARRLDIKNAPEYKGYVGIIHSVSIGDGTFTSSFDVSFEDESYNLVANTPDHALVDIDPLVNARFAYLSANGSWQIALWGKNLTDEEYARASAASSFTQYASPPLTWGVDLGYNF